MQNLPTNKVPVSVAVPFNLLSETEQFAKSKDVSRSDYIVGAIRMRNEAEKKLQES